MSKATFAQQIDSLVRPKAKTPDHAKTFVVQEGDFINPPILYHETPTDISDRLWVDACLAWLAKIDNTAANAVGTASIMLERFDADSAWATTQPELAELLQQRARLVFELSQAGDYARRAQSFTGRMREAVRLGTITRGNADRTLPKFVWHADD